MERVVWKGRIKDGMLEEYIRRHDHIWPELSALFREAGIKNYTIWNSGTELFGYYECADSYSRSAAIRARNPITRRWNEYMKDIFALELDPATGEPVEMKRVFLHE